MSAPLVGVLGAGAWGTTLAWLFARGGARVRLWSGNEDKRRAIVEARRSPAVPDLELPDNIEPVADPALALEAGLVALSMQPAWIRTMLRTHGGLFRADHRVVHAVRGFEPRGQTISQVIEAETRVLRTGALAGPVVPRELWGGSAAAAVIGSNYQSVIDEVTERLAGPKLRVYGTRDLLGVEIAGAMRTPVALAAGMLTQLGFRISLSAVMLTRAVAEAGRLADAVGGTHETMSGLAGIGDWMVTCVDAQDPLIAAGGRLARGEPLNLGEAEARVRTLVSLADRHGVEMPITRAVCAVLDGKPLKEAVSGLMQRRQRAEAV